MDKTIELVDTKIEKPDDTTKYAIFFTKPITDAKGTVYPFIEKVEVSKEQLLGDIKALNEDKARRVNVINEHQKQVEAIDLEIAKINEDIALIDKQISGVKTVK